jgi:predicted Kef-type K+ transport protein
MTASRFHLSGFPRAIGLAVLQNLVAVLWLAASPALHAAADKDASEPEHGKRPLRRH